MVFQWSGLTDQLAAAFFGSGFCAVLVLAALALLNVTAFCGRNAGKNTVETIGPLSIKHVILTDKQMSELFDTKGKDGWQEFYKVYPKAHGIISLSRPGFSRDGRLAVIYMGNQSDWEAGRGRIYVLEKNEGKWCETHMGIGPRWVS